MSDDCLNLVSHLGPRGQANDDRARVPPPVQRQGGSQPTSSPLPNPPPQQPRQHQQQRPAFLTPRQDSSHEVELPLKYERAAGVDVFAHRVDAITRKLSRQHLHQDYEDPSTTPTQLSISSSSTAIPFRLPAEFELEVDPAFLAPSPSAGIMPMTASLMPPDEVPSGLYRAEDRDLVGRRPSSVRKTTLSRRRPSPQFRNITQNHRANDTPSEGLTCARTLPTVIEPPAVPLIDTGAHEATLMEIDATCLEVDSNLSGATECDILLEKLTEARRLGGPLGMKQVVHRSSTETALRCRNVVRNKPRMRKRTKLRDQSSLPAMSAAAGLPAAFTS